MAELAGQRSGCPVIEGDFVDYDFSLLKVDALILIGALVHVHQNDLASILVKICKALKQGGHILLSLKEGKGVLQHEDGRLFHLWTDLQLRQIFSDSGFSVVDFFFSERDSCHLQDTLLSIFLGVILGVIIC